MMREKRLEEICTLISWGQEHGGLLPRSRETIEAMVDEERCVVSIDPKTKEVTGFVGYAYQGEWVVVGPVITKKKYVGAGVASKNISRLVRRLAGQKLIASCTPKCVSPFLKNGFSVAGKGSAPECVWGGRSREEWLDCDRTFVAN